MKKVKLIPSLIMLVLCIGVLAVGVYALTPISNSIAGTISISAGKASIAITGYIDNTEVYPRTELHEGMEWAIASSNLYFNASNYFFPEDVPSKVIRLKIENLSSVPYGVFFCDHADVNATSSNIKTTGEIKSISDSSKTIVNASMDYYKYISSTDSNSTLDQVDMTITLSVASLTASAQTGKFTYYLNIEEYNSSIGSTEEFIKVDDSLTTIEASAYADNTSIKNVIIPSTIASIGARAFSGCTGLTEITIPSSVTTIGAGAFDGCNNLQKIIVDAHSASGTFGDDANFPNISGKAWQNNGELVTSNVLYFSTDRLMFTAIEAEGKTIKVSVEYGGTSSITSGAVTSGEGVWYVGQTVSLVIDIPDLDTTASGPWTVRLRDSADSSYNIQTWEGLMPANPFPITYSFKLESDSILNYTFYIVIEIMG